LRTLIELSLDARRQRQTLAVTELKKGEIPTTTCQILSSRMKS
jgi:hypothetical protein